MEIKLLRSASDKELLRTSCDALFIPFFDIDMLEHRTYLAAFSGENIVGLACFVEYSSRVPGAMGLAYLSTHPDSRQKGVATALAAALFEQARTKKLNIANTHYEPDGEKWLKPVLQRTALAFPDVQLFER